MKKFLKILLIIIGIVFLIFAALICIGLFVDYDDHIENGRYTYVPEDDNKDNAYVEFNLSDYDKKDSELIYYSSVEEAILNSPLNAENEEFSVPEDCKPPFADPYLSSDIHHFRHSAPSGCWFQSPYPCC